MPFYHRNLFLAFAVAVDGTAFPYPYNLRRGDCIMAYLWIGVRLEEDRKESLGIVLCEMRVEVLIALQLGPSFIICRISGWHWVFHFFILFLFLAYIASFESDSIDREVGEQDYFSEWAKKESVDMKLLSLMI